jgi:hypothetical protein
LKLLFEGALNIGLLALPTPNFFFTSNGLNASFFYPDELAIPDDPTGA